MRGRGRLLEQRRARCADCGVPVFVLADFAAAYRMGTPDLTQIESPVYPDGRQTFVERAWRTSNGRCVRFATAKRGGRCVSNSPLRIYFGWDCARVARVCGGRAVHSRAHVAARGHSAYLDGPSAGVRAGISGPPNTAMGDYWMSCPAQRHGNRVRHRALFCPDAREFRGWALFAMATSCVVLTSRNCSRSATRKYARAVRAARLHADRQR